MVETCPELMTIATMTMPKPILQQPMPSLAIVCKTMTSMDGDASPPAGVTAGQIAMRCRKHLPCIKRNSDGIDQTVMVAMVYFDADNDGSAPAATRSVPLTYRVMATMRRTTF